LIIRRLIVPLALAFVTVHAGQGFAQGAFPAPLPGQAGQKNDPAFPPVQDQAGQKNDPAFPPVQGQAGTRNDPAFPPVAGQAVRASASPFPSVNGAAPLTSFPGGAPAPMPGGEFAPGAPTQQAGGDACVKAFMALREEAAKRGALIKAAGERHAAADEACKLFENFSQAEIKMMKYIEANTAKCGIPPQILGQLTTGHKTNTEPMLKKICMIAQQQQKGPAGPSLSEVLGSSTALPEATTKKGGSAFDTMTGNVLTR
jgi:hypothetical protein